MNDRAVSLFLELLRSAIWNRPADESLFQCIGLSVWEDVINLAESQKVNALLYDGVMTLPGVLHPEKKVLYKLFLQAGAIEKLNERLNDELRNLTSEYGKMNCPFILLKGQANATLYPKPEHRAPGDIDLFLYRKGDYGKANEWAREKGYKMDAENIHHQSFEINGTHVENHKNISYFGIKKYDNLLEREIQEIIRNQRFIELEIDELKVEILPVEFNAFYLFYHLFHHFIHLGIGVRQFCDWTLFMHLHSQQMDKEVLVSLAKQFDLLNAMEIFASAAVKYMGAEPEIFPFNIDVEGKFVDLVMADMLRGGNFGFSTFKNKSFRGKWDAKWHRFNYSTRRAKKISGIAPHHIKSLAITKIITNLKLLFKK
ncbi:MAG: hypothetical protein BGO33_03285 [Bacteroidia bacterium 43-41]|nr:MAG: hypothetical protein BGO33_03285 [Bacteroidia bacterium 43-41]